MNNLNSKGFVSDFLKINALCLTLIVSLALSSGCKQNRTIRLGQMGSGAEVNFVKDSADSWGISVSIEKTPIMYQNNPVILQIFKGKDDIKDLPLGYSSVQREGSSVVAVATEKYSDDVTFDVKDEWSIEGDVLFLNRKLLVRGTEDNSGFTSSVRLSTQGDNKWEDFKFLAPGLLYGEPHTNARSTGGSMYYDAGFFSVREDYLSAPLMGLLFKNGNWVTLIDAAPDGATTIEETTARADTAIIDERIRFGALNINRQQGGNIELGFCMPGTTEEFASGFGFGPEPSASANPTFRYRYHPVKDGLEQSYRLGFNFGRSDTFREMESKAWRMAWQVLDPEVMPVDVDLVRTTLIDHLADRIIKAGDRAGIPFVIDAVTGNPGSYRPALRSYSFSGRNQTPAVSPEIKNLAMWAKTVGIDMDTRAAELNLWPMIVMGFCGKHVEAGEQLLIEGYRDNSPRGQRMIELGTTIIESLIKYVPMSPYPAGEAFNLQTGKPGSARIEGAYGLRPLSEDMRIMMDIIIREKSSGREHPEWLSWARDYADWLLTQQRNDGSFPMNWLRAEVTDTSGACTYAAIPFLIKLSDVTGDIKYQDAAIKAGNYVWDNSGNECYYLGATGTATVADKESGMLSLEAFLSLYEKTKDAKWLEYARSAGDYAESWIWIWNVPMPTGAQYSDLGWKPGIPTIGVNGIGSNDIGGVDQYMSWSVPSYARLYKYTGDEHYLEVAKVLLHGTKAMLALPGRTFDLKGPGWQQEHWKMGPVRGVGAHRTWLPWVSINHLHGITGLEEFDSDLFRQLSELN